MYQVNIQLGANTVHKEMLLQSSGMQHPIVQNNISLTFNMAKKKKSYCDNGNILICWRDVVQLCTATSNMAESEGSIATFHKGRLTSPGLYLSDISVCTILLSSSYETLLFPPQVIVLPLPAVGIAVLLTTLTCMCLEGTTQTMMSQEAQRMKTIHCSESFGGTTLPQAAGSRFEQRVICPQSWRPCQVKHCIPNSISHFDTVHVVSSMLHTKQKIQCFVRNVCKICKLSLPLLCFFSCFAWQQPPGVWRHGDPLRWK